MGLTVTEEAKQFIEKKMTGDETIILDYENGDSLFTKIANSCTLDYNYQLILLANKEKYDLSKYTESFDTSIGTVWTTRSGADLLDKHTKLAFNPSYYSLKLTGDSGMITSSVDIEKR